MEVINDLLRIKIFREEQAERALKKARVALAEAGEALKKANLALKEFTEESIRREKSMYDDLCTRLVFLKEIENVRIDIDLMKEKSTELKKKVESAELNRKDCAEREIEAHMLHVEAVRMREKFNELRKTVAEEKEMALAQFEELEMEEAASVRFNFQTE
jgi:type III secretion protein O